LEITVPIELSRKESIPNGIRRIVTERIKTSLKTLDSKTGFHDQAVHAVRRHLKEARAALRLVRFDLGESYFRQENTFIRSATRPLSEVRDAAVMIDALDKLLRHQKFQPLRIALSERRDRIRRRVLRSRHTVEKIETALHKALTRAGRLPVHHKGWNAVKPGLRRSYEQGRRAMADALHAGSEEALHEWRKRVKYQRHHLEILRNSCKKEVEPLAHEARALSNVLGEHHDLSVLKQLVNGELSGVLNNKEQTALLDLIAKRQQKLQKKAAKLGRQLCAEKGKEFVSRMHEYWQSWR
jgi:CHAD domain-containing protein